MFGYADMKFKGGIANGQTINVDVLPIVLITVYRPIPASFNKEWVGCMQPTSARLEAIILAAIGQRKKLIPYYLKQGLRIGRFILSTLS